MKCDLRLQVNFTLVGRAPQGARGLKSIQPAQLGQHAGRAPQGARGLKFVDLKSVSITAQVAPRKGRVG